LRSTDVTSKSSPDDDGKSQLGAVHIMADLRQKSPIELLRQLSAHDISDDSESCFAIDALVGHVKNEEYQNVGVVDSPHPARAPLKNRAIDQLKVLAFREDTLIGQVALNALADIGGRDAIAALYHLYKSNPSSHWKCEIANAVGNLDCADQDIANFILDDMRASREPSEVRASIEARNRRSERMSLTGEDLESLTNALAQSFISRASCNQLDMNAVNIRAALSGLVDHLRPLNVVFDPHTVDILSNILQVLREEQPNFGPVDPIAQAETARIANEYLDVRDEREALLCALQGIVAEPNNTELWTVVSDICLGCGEHELMVDIYTFIVWADPDDFEAIKNLEELGDYYGDQAIDE
jgi:hypothetical protein